MATNCDDWEPPIPLMNGSAAPLGPMAKGRKPKPLGLLASWKRAQKPPPKVPRRR